jgi:Tfp pilus assembly protein PilO
MAKQIKSLDLLKIVNGSVQAKTYSFGAFTLIVAIILIAFAIRPTVVKITEINKEIQEKKVVELQLKNKLTALATLTNEYAKNEVDIKSLPLIFPASGNFSLLLSNLEEISSANGFNLIGINFQKADKFDTDLIALKPWSVRVSVAGNKANLIKLLGQVESMPLYPIITKIAYTDEVDSNGQNIYSFEMVVFKVDDSKFYN